MLFPTLHTVAGGRFEAQCGGCTKFSPGVEASSPDAAWTALHAMGWTQRHAYALCPACTADPPDPDKDAAAAKRRRKRK
jgi:hypothetical protein